MSLPYCLTNPTLRYATTKHGAVVLERMGTGRQGVYVAGVLLGYVHKKNSRHWDSYRPDGSLMYGETNCTRARAIERLQEVSDGR